MTTYAKEHDITIAVMGCRVNGPGETDDADLGLWCGPNFVNLKRGPETLGQLHVRRDPRPRAHGARQIDRGEARRRAFETNPLPRALASSMIVADAWTKWLVVARIDLHESIPLIPNFFQLVHVRNTGAAFGIGANADSRDRSAAAQPRRDRRLLRRRRLRLPRRGHDDQNTTIAPLFSSSGTRLRFRVRADAERGAGVAHVDDLEEVRDQR